VKEKWNKCFLQIIFICLFSSPCVHRAGNQRVITEHTVIREASGKGYTAGKEAPMVGKKALTKGD
jgi:hypothetical protein